MKAWLMKLFGRAAPGGIDCHEVGKVLQQYLDGHLDGHLDAERAQRIEAHLDACRRCGMEAETYTRIKSALAAHGEVSAESLTRLRNFAERLARGEKPAGE